MGKDLILELKGSDILWPQETEMHSKTVSNIVILLGRAEPFKWFPLEQCLFPKYAFRLPSVCLF